MSRHGLAEQKYASWNLCPDTQVACLDMVCRGRKSRSGNIVESWSIASIDKRLWSDWAKIFQACSWHVNSHCERWRSDLDCFILVFEPMCSNLCILEPNWANKKNEQTPPLAIRWQNQYVKPSHHLPIFTPPFCHRMTKGLHDSWNTSQNTSNIWRTGIKVSPTQKYS